ncbi:MAG: hypothetical protein ACM3YN_01305 [Parcubacteria group bacterium]
MIRLLAPLAVMLTLGACSEALPGASYSLGSGIASYDDLRRATEQCNTRGGHIEPKNDGGDPAELSNYTCVIGKGN